MSQPVESAASARKGYTSRRFFARYYERTSRSPQEERFMGPLRREVIEQASGRVLEIGAGNGLNFALYDPTRVEHVTATEPDSAMLEYARQRTAGARVPVELVRTPVENLPFADESFDSVVVTLVFCSVNDPQRGLSEVRRVLKPGGTLLMVEHVRAENRLVAAVQHVVTPLARLFTGNCHWNRETGRFVREAGFTIEQRRTVVLSVIPFMVVRALK